MFAVGDIVGAKFRIDRVLGQGGMGVVVAATHLQLGQRVALKFLLPELSADPALVGRFLREARSSAQLRSDHVCHVSDVGTSESGAPYIVMELLHGRDLASVLADNGPIPVPLLADYVVQACVGLAEAHAARIVHRDLKPANLFLTNRADGTTHIKLLDFGIAKAPTEANLNLTDTIAVMGSPGYMSPEQLRSSRDVDARTDIWSLGVILYELATGRPPFTAATITELALRVTLDPTPPLGGAPPHGFEHVVYRCLEKNPARRFQDVAQLALALAPLGSPATRQRALGAARVLSAGSDADSPQSAAYALAAAATTLGASASSLDRPPSAGRRKSLVAAAVVAGLASVGVYELSNRAEPAPPSRPSGAQSEVPALRRAAVANSAYDAGAPDSLTVVDATTTADSAFAADATTMRDPNAAGAAARGVDAGTPGNTPPPRDAGARRNIPKSRPPKDSSDDDVGSSRL